MNKFVAETSGELDLLLRWLLANGYYKTTVETVLKEGNQVDYEVSVEGMESAQYEQLLNAFNVMVLKK